MRNGFLIPATLAVTLAVLPGSAGATSTTCTTTVVCAEYINTSSGVAIHGEANSGIGVRGTSVSNTGFYGASGSGSAGTPGVEGESTNGTGNDAAGAFGLSYLAGKAAPAYGAIAYGSQYAIFGESANPGTSSAGYGLYGFDPVQTVSNNPDENVAVFGRTTVGTSVLAEANGTPQVGGAFGDAPIGLYALAETHTGTKNPLAFAIFAETNSIGLDIHNSVNASTFIISSAGDFISAYANTGGSLTVDYSGNETISGALTTEKGTYVRALGTGGVAMREYGARTTTPDVEDIGEGQLANGRAYVAIDARLAGTIDRRAIYHVFLTPEGDCNGLYVTQKGPGGFAVRELRGGRSSLAFEYRIVAKPIDENGTRLATMPPETTPKDGSLDGVVTASHPGGSSVPVSPEAAMQQRLGARGYAQTLSAIRARETGR